VIASSNAEPDRFVEYVAVALPKIRSGDAD
jgi:hypothetical protein